MNTAPKFRPVGVPLDVPDAALEQINRQRGVPTLIAPTPTEATPATRLASPRLRPLNIHVPDYVFRSIKQRAHDADTSIRFIVMKALSDAGIDIDPVDLIEDARRKRD